MSIPKLEIPVSYDLKSFEQQSAQMSSKVGESVKAIGQVFSRVNGEMLGVAASSAGGAALAWSQAAARTALSFAGMAALAYGGYKIVASLISEAREQIVEMVQVAEKAQALRLSPETFQSFTKSAGTAKDTVKELEEALTHFQDKNKSVLDPNAPVGEIEQYKRKFTELESIIGGLKIDLLADATAANQFLHALSDDEKPRAALAIIQQLLEQGQKLEALNLAEKMFGGKFADNLRNGKNDVADMVANLDRLRAASGDAIFSDAAVQRAKEVNDHLDRANRELHDNMHPAIEAVSRALLGMKSDWADVVDLIAKAAALIPKIPQEIQFTGPIKGNIEEQITQLRSLLDGQYSRREGLRSGFGDMMSGDTGALDKLNADITKTESRLAALEMTLVALNNGVSGADVPLPRMRPTNAPGPEDKDTGDEGKRDRFDSLADSIQKRTAALQAEADAWDKTTEAREKAKVIAELTTVAMQANAAAGKGENVVTAEQRDRINEVAEAFGKAKAAIEAAHSPLATFARESANVNMALNKFAASTLDNTTNALADVVSGAKSAKEAFRDLAQSIIHDLAAIAIRASITGPIASLLFPSFFAASGAGGVIGNGLPLGMGGIGHAAAGGDFEAGEVSVVGEEGPELVRFGRSGTVIPNHKLGWPGGRGAGGSSIMISQHFDFTNADKDSEARLRAMASEIRRQSVEASVQAVQSARASNPQFFG